MSSIIKRSFLFLTIIMAALNIQGQLHTSVLKGLEGPALEEALVDLYKPSVTMPYGMARDTLYAKIDVNDDGDLECIYTGFKIRLSGTQDPTQEAFDKGINAEHSYPQSKGADSGLGRSDLNHLYPSKIDVNADRGSYPYGESPDAATDFWYFESQILQNPPSLNRDNYSELLLDNLSYFEPRESVKGNIARGIFYFYTMYRPEALDADPQFFGIQRETLCDWHFADPVDDREWKRTHDIAPYQDNKVNPFILDCSLAARTYCDIISVPCEMLTGVADWKYVASTQVSDIFPNPTSSTEASIVVNSVDFNDLEAILYDMTGVEMQRQYTSLISDQSIVIPINLPDQIGIYIVKLIFDDNQVLYRKVIKL